MNTDLFPAITVPAAGLRKMLASARIEMDALAAESLDFDSRRRAVRETMLQDGRIRRMEELPGSTSSITPRVYAVDGAYATDRFRGDSVCAFAAAAVQHDPAARAVAGLVGLNAGLKRTTECVEATTEVDPQARFAAGVFTVPQDYGADVISRGLMFMLEIVLASRLAKQDPEAIIFSDGAPISSIVSIGQFYVEAEKLLADWRHMPSEEEPGRTLREFEAGPSQGLSWLAQYAGHARIVGCPKLITTKDLVGRYDEQNDRRIRRLNDSTFATSVLEPGEYIEPFPVPPPAKRTSFHVYADMETAIPGATKAILELTRDNVPAQLLQTYYRPTGRDLACKIEVSRAFLDAGRLPWLLEWWRDRIRYPGLQEPFPLVLVDGVCKQLVHVGLKAARHLHQRRAENFIRSYRTE